VQKPTVVDVPRKGGLRSIFDKTFLKVFEEPERSLARSKPFFGKECVTKETIIF
jgi:hypothetical protein